MNSPWGSLQSCESSKLHRASLLINHGSGAFRWLTLNKSPKDLEISIIVPIFAGRKYIYIELSEIKSNRE